MQTGMESEVGLGPYGMTVFLAMGALFGALAFGIFFVFLPVEGELSRNFQYCQRHAPEHLMGWLGGAVLGTAVGQAGGRGREHQSWIRRRPASRRHAGKPRHGFHPRLFWPVIAAVLGFLVWKEVKDDTRGPARWMAAAMPILFLGGIALISLNAAIPIVP